MIKYRVNEVAKDLNLQNKDIIDILAKNGIDNKKSTAVLEKNELDMIFEAVTKQNESENFNAYFASANAPKEVKKPAEEKKAPQQNKDNRNNKPKEDKKPQQDRNNNNKDNRNNRPNQDNKQRNERQGENKNRPQQDRVRDEHKPMNKPQVKTEDKVNENKPQFDKNKSQKPNNQNNQNKEVKAPVNNQPKEKAKARPQQETLKLSGASNEKSKFVSDDEMIVPTTRVVDTRTSNINIEKYNEKYDSLAFDRNDRGGNNESAATKQKFTNRKPQKETKKKGKKETEAERLNRIAQERKAKSMTITVGDEITVGDFALKLKATSAEVVKKLMMMGVFATVNDVIDFDTASLIADEFHAKVEKEVVVTIEDRIIDDSEDDDANLSERAPVVVVMGHVDHGKTSILDAIRHSNVTLGEAGGITQHIGAYTVKVDDRDITFLDTPGHAAFTTMRARGAQVTDIAVLVVAADDGIMPQTVEAINHAKAAGVSIIVAINKMDKPTANPDQVKQQLTEYELVPEEWGGDVPCIPVSAHTKMGIDDLLEMILLTADIKELKANPDRAAKGTVIEARLDKGRGPIATILVQNGTLHTGDIVVAGTTVGRVRAMMNDKGRKVDVAGPSVPVEITGLNEVPTGGDIFNAVSDERLARELVEQRLTKEKEDLFNSQTKVTLDNLFDQMKVGEMKELKIIVKADVQGSVEAVRQSLEKLTNEEVRVNVIHGAVGAVNESDVMLANASNAIIVGFNVRPDSVAEESAKRDGVDMRLYRIIYDCIEEIEAAMKGMLAPKFREVNLGKAECREVYKISNVGMVIGGHVTSGKILRNALVRVVRDGIIVADDKIASLRRFKDDVREVADGYDCGITLEKFGDIKIGDILEVYNMEEYRPE